MDCVQTSKSKELTKYINTVGMLCALFIILHKLDVIKGVLGFIGISSGSTYIALGIYILLDCAVLYCVYKCILSDKNVLAVITGGILLLLVLIPFVQLQDYYGAVQIIVFSGSIIACGVIIASYDGGYKSFVNAFLQIGKAMIVLSILYVIILMNLNPDKLTPESPLKFIVGYGVIAWFFLPVAIIYIIEICFSEEVGKNFSSWISILCMMTAICYTGLRTAYVTLGVTAFFVLLFSFRKSMFDRKRTIIKLIFIAIIFSVVFQLCTHVVPRASRLVAFENRVFYEMSNHISDVNGDYIVYDVQKEEEETIDNVFGRYIIESDTHRLETQEMLQNDVKSKEYKYIKPLDHDSEKYSKKYYWKTDRINLWTAAVKEFMKSPITGNGSRYFVDKYDGFFPHNMILELLADYGIVGCGIMIGLYIVLMISFLKRSFALNDKYRIIFLIYSLAMVPEYILYSTIYTDMFLHLPVTVFVIDFLMAQKRKKEHMEQISQ